MDPQIACKMDFDGIKNVVTNYQPYARNSFRGKNPVVQPGGFGEQNT
jgi:hypothetical protein